MQKFNSRKSKKRLKEARYYRKKFGHMDYDQIFDEIEKRYKRMSKLSEQFMPDEPDIRKDEEEYLDGLFESKEEFLKSGMNDFFQHHESSGKLANED